MPLPVGPVTSTIPFGSASAVLNWMLGKLAEKSFTTTPERIVGEGDDVVVITKITAGGKSGLQADVLTYRSGKLVKAVSIADTALQERVFGAK